MFRIALALRALVREMHRHNRVTEREQMDLRTFAEKMAKHALAPVKLPKLPRFQRAKGQRWLDRKPAARPGGRV